MRRTVNLFAPLAAAAAISGFSCIADVIEAPVNRYKSIVDRNAFGLKPPPPPTKVTNTAPVVPTNIKLAGITSDKSGKVAWLILQASGNKPAEHFAFHEGQQQGDVKVVKIDQKTSAVEITQNGAPIKLTYTTHGLAASKAAVPAPGAPPLPGQPAVGAAGIGARPALGAAGPTIVGRGGVVSTLSQPTFGNVGTIPPAGINSPTAFLPGGGQIQVPNSGDSLRTIPSRMLRAGNVQDQPQAPIVNPEVQAIMMQANKLETERRGILMPPLPPMPGEVPMPPGGVLPNRQ